MREMVAKANAIEKAFNVFRAEVDGKKLSENDVRKVLKESKSSDERRKVWAKMSCTQAKEGGWNEQE